MKRALLAAALCLGLAACSTPYGPRGLTGGYTETKKSDNVYTVSFQGNGNTSGDTVWSYWIYRCAELTLLQGYTAFSLDRKDKKTSSIEGGMRNAAWPADDGDAPRFTPVKGGGAPMYIYTPGYTITTYNASADVLMYRAPYPASTGPLLKAQSVVDSLKPFVQKTETAPPARMTVLEKAIFTPGSAL